MREMWGERGEKREVERERARGGGGQQMRHNDSAGVNRS